MTDQGRTPSRREPPCSRCGRVACICSEGRLYRQGAEPGRSLSSNEGTAMSGDCHHEHGALVSATASLALTQAVAAAEKGESGEALTARAEAIFAWLVSK